MAKIQLSESTFSLIPEGVTVFKVASVDDSKYEDFGKITVELKTAKGETHNERFTLINKNGELNEGALRAWSFFARTCLNNSSLTEIDTQDIVGCYISATVKHESYEYTNKDGETKTGTNARLNDYTVASYGFKSPKTDEEYDRMADAGLLDTQEDNDDLDSFLDE